MLYTLHETGYYGATPLRLAALATRNFWSSPLNPARDTDFGRRVFATADRVSNLPRRYRQPEWGIDSVQIDGEAVKVRPHTVWSSPWVKLTHFARDMADMRKAGRNRLEPAVLIVAPLSGHYATLLRGTVQAFLQDHEVYITEWQNARSVPVMEGRFDFHDYIDHVREMLRFLGPRPHVVAVCQPGPPVLAATALMAEDEEASPRLRGLKCENRIAAGDVKRGQNGRRFQRLIEGIVPASSIHLRSHHPPHDPANRCQQRQ